MHIRNARFEDAEAIASLAGQLGYPPTPAEVENSMAIILQHADHAALVAEDADGTVCGWVHEFLARRLFMPAFAEIGGIVVDERRRGEGIGRALVEGADDNKIPRQQDG